MYRMLIVLGFSLSLGVVAVAEPADIDAGIDPEADASPARTVDELAVLLEERVSLLTAILGIQSELLALARRDAEAAFLARPAMSQCVRALPELWCNQLTGTFRPGDAP